MELAIVTAADSRYFNYAKGLVLSLLAARGPLRCALCCIDVGCDEDELAWLRAHVDHVAEGRWDVAFPAQARTPRHLQALTCRPFLPEYFPGHEVYLWIDADAWVQDWAAVELFVEAASTGELAVVPEIDRSYSCHYDTGLARLWMHRCYTAAFNIEVANRFWWMPVLGAGAFACRRGAPPWLAWAKRLGSAVRRTLYAVDQTSLNYAVYRHEIRAHFLPSTCNWMCTYALPMLDEATGALVDPNLPRAPLGVVHLAGPVPKRKRVRLSTVAGTKVWRSLKYRGGDY